MAGWRACVTAIFFLDPSNVYASTRAYTPIFTQCGKKFSIVNKLVGLLRFLRTPSFNGALALTRNHITSAKRRKKFSRRCQPLTIKRGKWHLKRFSSAHLLSASRPVRKNGYKTHWTACIGRHWIGNHPRCERANGTSATGDSNWALGKIIAE